MPLLGDQHRQDLAAWEAEPVTVGYGDETIGGGPLGNRIARLVSRALRDTKEAGTSRAEVAAKMTEMLGRQISEAQLHKWASEAAEEHRIQLDAFIALIQVTAQHALLGFVPAQFGFAVVDARYVDLIELQQIEEHERQVAARKAVLQAKVRGRR